jgi:hypothetical protein
LTLPTAFCKPKVFVLLDAVHHFFQSFGVESLSFDFTFCSIVVRYPLVLVPETPGLLQEPHPLPLFSCTTKAPSRCDIWPRFQPDAVPTMSLNGLDNPTVIEAYQIALAEAGGWYVHRSNSYSYDNYPNAYHFLFNAGFCSGMCQGMKLPFMSGGQGVYPTCEMLLKATKNVPRSMAFYNIGGGRSCSVISLKTYPDSYEVCSNVDPRSDYEHY